MPVRESIENEERFIGRILPKSRIRMIELLPEAIASGTYETDIEICSGEKVIAKKTHRLEVDASNFPAQEVLIAQLGNDVQVSPAQIELSQLRGGNRRMTMLFKNSGKETKNIELSATDKAGLTLNAAMIQPSKFTIAPNGSRKISITLKSQSDSLTSTVYGTLLVRSQSDRKDFDETKILPIAIALKKHSLPELKLSTVQWDTNGKFPCFRGTVSNLGETHYAIDARLSIFDEKGGRIQIPAGFGKWLMPGETSKLEFRVEQGLASGKYQLKCELQHGDKPLVVEQAFEVTDLENSKSSKPVSVAPTSNKEFQ